jgi:hypothetical protein
LYQPTRTHKAYEDSDMHEQVTANPVLFEDSEDKASDLPHSKRRYVHDSSSEHDAPPRKVARSKVDKNPVPVDEDR